jgi:outer membrane autotransporter protein
LSLDSLRFGPEVALDGEFVDVGGVSFRPRGQLGWTQQLGLSEREVRMTLPSGASGKLDLEDGDEGYLNLGLGVDVVFDTRTSAHVSFEGDYGSNRSNTTSFAGVSIDLW